MRRSVPVVLFRLLLSLLTLTGSGQARPARADDLSLTATAGVGGRYRPGTWLPIQVSLTNRGADTVHAQVQALAAPAPERGAFGAPPGPRGLAASLFVRPVVLSGASAPQTVTLYTRNLDPNRDDVTVQMVDGARGDGRVLAKFSLSSPGLAVAVAGTPVSSRDLFLIGVADDPSGWTFLNGQTWGLAHTPDGPAAPTGFRPPPGMVPTTMLGPAAQIAGTAVAALPDKSVGYSGADAVLLRTDAPLDAMTEAQADALRGWVASGGRLIVCGGSDASRLDVPALAGLLPASAVTGTPGGGAPPLTPVPALRLTPKPLPGVQIVSRAGDGTPLVVSGPYGAGTVVFAGLDPTTLPYQRWTGPAEQAFWRTLVTAGGSAPSSLLGHVVARQEEAGSGYGWSGPSLSQAVIRAPALDPPSTGVIGLFLLAYVIILVPVNYLILKRLDRREWAWLTVPALVVLFALGTYGIGYAAKGGALFVNRAAIVETSAGARQAGVYAEVGLFSPHRTSYDLTLPDPNAVAALPTTRDDWRSRYGRGESSETYGQTRLVQTPREAAVQDASVNMWAMRAFDVQTAGDLGGAVTASFGAPRGMSRIGTIQNGTAHALTGCAVFYHGQWQMLGDLPSGGRRAVTLSEFLPLPAPGGGARGFSTGGQFALPMGGIGSPGGPVEERTGDVRLRLRAALADFIRSLGTSEAIGYYGGYSGGYVGSGTAGGYTPHSDEAILVGWNDDPSLAGPPVRVDGRVVHQNDVCLLVVHLPVSPARP